MRYIFIIAITLFSMQSIYAQYGYGRGYGGYGGYGRSRMSSMGASQTPQGPTEEPPTVLRTYLEDYFNNIMALQKDQTKDQETMRKDFERMQNEFKTNLKSIMTEEEVEKLIAMDFSSSAVRKRKKKRDN